MRVCRLKNQVNIEPHDSRKTCGIWSGTFERVREQKGIKSILTYSKCLAPFSKKDGVKWILMFILSSIVNLDIYIE